MKVGVHGDHHGEEPLLPAALLPPPMAAPTMSSSSSGGRRSTPGLRAILGGICGGAVLLLLVPSLQIWLSMRGSTTSSSPTVAAETLSEVHTQGGALLQYRKKYDCYKHRRLSSGEADHRKPPLGAVVGTSLLEAAWSIADVDGDGQASREEMLAAFDAGHLPQRVIERVEEAHGHGAVGHEAFVAALTGGDASFAAFAQAAWDVADGDGDGRVSRGELGRLQWYKALPAGAFKELTKADDDKDGSLEKSEFLSALRGGGTDAAAEEAAAVQAWSPAQKEWCCRTADIGCWTSPLASGTTEDSATKRFNCRIGFQRWERAWPLQQQQYCCRHFRRGCGASDVTSGSDSDAPAQTV